MEIWNFTRKSLNFGSVIETFGKIISENKKYISHGKYKNSSFCIHISQKLNQYGEKSRLLVNIEENNNISVICTQV